MRVADKQIDSWNSIATTIREEGEHKKEDCCELSKQNKDYDDLRNFEGVLGEQGTVCVSRSMILIECKDVDEVTTKEEIVAGLKDQLTDMQKTNINSLRRAYEGTRTTPRTMSLVSAIKAMSLGKVRIEWVVCRLRKFHQKMVNDCNNTIVRSDLCGRCGGTKDCTKNPFCLHITHQVRRL